MIFRVFIFFMVDCIDLLPTNRALLCHGHWFLAEITLLVFMTSDQYLIIAVQ